MTISGQTLIQHFIIYLKSDGQYETILALQKVANNSVDYDIKNAAVIALSEQKNEKGLESLISIAKAHKNIYEYPSEFSENKFYCTLVEAIGSYGKKAIPVIFQEIQIVDKSNMINSAINKNPTEFYEKYFSKRFDALLDDVSEISESKVKKNEISSQINKLEQSLIDNLKSIENKLPVQHSYRRKYIDLLIDSLRSIDVKRDRKIYLLSKRILLDNKYNYETKKRSVSLLSNHGSIDDTALILLYINQINDDRFKERALLSIGALHLSKNKSFLKKDSYNPNKIGSCD